VCLFYYLSGGLWLEYGQGNCQRSTAGGFPGEGADCGKQLYCRYGGLRENAEDAVKNLAESAAEIELNRKTDADNLYKCLISLPSCSTIRHVRKYQPH